MIETQAPETATPTVRWGRVGLFVAIAFGWVCLIAAGLYLTGNRSLGAGDGISLLTVGLAALAMPAPLVAALVVERLDRRPALIRTALDGLGRALPRILLVTVASLAALVLAMLALSWLLGNRFDVNGVGRVLFTREDLVANTLVFLPSMDADAVSRLTAVTPSLWPLLAITLGLALVAGFTVNGLFAFGEEYGWRGWLADELRPLGAFRANLVTGVLWGLWHAPLILLGLNYGGYGQIGVVLMVAWCVPMSFLLWRARRVTGSLLTPAVLHGALNGFAGVFTIVLVDTNPMVAAPLGVVAIVAATVVAAGFWLLTRKRAGRAA